MEDDSREILRSQLHLTTRHAEKCLLAVSPGRRGNGLANGWLSQSLSSMDTSFLLV